jgi:hypothetical protein
MSRHYQRRNRISSFTQLRNHPLFQLLNQKHRTLLAVSDGGTDISKNYGSFAWVHVLGTKQEIVWECKDIARGYPMQSYRAEGYGRLSLLSFLTHYLLYLEIQTPDDICITFCCDNHSLLTNEETCHTRDIDSSSWYPNPDHDSISASIVTRSRSSRRTQRIQPSSTTFTTQCSYRRTRFQSSRGLPSS